MPTRPSTRLSCLFALLAFALPGCTKKAVVAPHENQRPIATFTRAPSRSGDLYSYSYAMAWAGFDPDGEVRGFLYAIDPPAPSAAVPLPDTVWISTVDFGGTFHFTASAPQPGAGTVAADYHTFVLKAVDDRGLTSAPQVVAFNASTVAPVARILDPAPSSRYRLYLPPAFTVTWEGFDIDGIASKKPVYYRVKLLGASTPITPAMMQQFPDTLIRYYAVRGWATWDSLGAEVSSYPLNTLSPLSDYSFCVVAFDEAGAYTPYSSGDINVINFRALYANTGGPVLTIFNDFFNYTYDHGVYAPQDRASTVFLEVPSGISLTFNWSATAQEGTDIRYYRWVLDTENLEDNTPRRNERTDWTYWSQPALQSRSATIGPFTTAGDHRFYIEVGDGNGLKSLGVIQFTVVVGSFDKPLGICDDTRLLLDRRSVGATTCIDKPLNRWPTAAELDTFLYARGGVPMKCYPAGSVSRQGIFYGYEYDTLNMRPGRTDLTPSLAQLARYRRLVWLVDVTGASYDNGGADLQGGQATLRYMNTSGHLNVLAAYLRQGGEVWLAGGGTVYAAIVPFNQAANDRPNRTFSAAQGELAPGRFVYDFMHWRSEIKPSSGLYTLTRSLGRLASSPGTYAQLPPTLTIKSLASGDSMPPWRTNSGDFYVTSYGIEPLTLPNPIVEDADNDPANGIQAVSMMDTLYMASGSGLAQSVPVMTVYHGYDNNRVIVTGFDLWSFNRSQLRQLVDGVLGGVWGLTRSVPQTAALRPRAERTIAASARPAPAAWNPPLRRVARSP